MNYSKLAEHRETHKKYSEYIMNINLPKLKENPEKELLDLFSHCDILANLWYHNRDLVKGAFGKISKKSTSTY